MIKRRSLLSILTIIAGCAPATDPSRNAVESNCLLQQYELPELAHSIDSNFDSDNFLSKQRIKIPASVMAEQVPGYKSHVLVRTTEQPQFLYLTFSSPHETQLLDESEAAPISEHRDLLRTPGESQYHWYLGEQSDIGLELWGSCSSNFQGSYNCMTQLTVGSVGVNYELYRENLPVYQQVEAFLQEQFDACDFHL